MKGLKTFVIALGIVLAAAGLCFSAEGLELFTNGTIYLDAGRKAGNLLIQDGVVAGSDVEAAKYPQAVVIDLKGAFAYPGFIDSHAHLMEAGTFFYIGANLIGCSDVDSMVKVLEEKVKTIPEGGFIVGAGFSLRDYDKWSLEDLAKIDQATGNRPAFLGDKLGHNAVANTACIKLCNITPETPVPLGGKMGLENGQVTGMFRESAMALPSVKIFASLADKDVKTGTLMMLKRWASIGYTGVVDLMGATGLRLMRPELFKEMEKEGALPLRVNYCYTIFNLKDVDDAAKFIGTDTDLVRFVGCKIFVDGAYAGGQAWTSWANKQGGHGLQEIYTDDIGGPELNLNRIVAKVEEYGMNMHYHTQGDLAIKAVLDALDKVVAEKGKLKGLHTLIHLAFPTDEEIARIKKFDGHVVCTVQPAFWQVEGDTDYYYGEKGDQAYPVKKLIDNGLSVGMSTDFSVCPPEYTPAMVVMGAAVTGGGKPQDHQPLSVSDMITGFTAGSAKTTGKDDIGSLDIGRKADIVIFDQDLYAVPPDKFSKDNPKVVATYVGGRVVYETSATTK